MARSPRARRTLAVAAAIVAGLGTGATAVYAAAGLPPGFRADVLAQGLHQPVDVAFAADGRTFVLDKTGDVLELTGGAPPRRLLSISTRVNQAIDRGMVGLALARDFTTTGHLFLGYAYDPPGALADGEGRRTSRVSRFTLDLGPGGVIAPESEQVVLGRHTPAFTDPDDVACPPPGTGALDCLPADFITHYLGTILVDPADGTLWVGNGDNAAFGSDDSLRAFDPNALSGKVLHIAPDGRGLPGHPFCPGETDLTRACTKVFAMGLRNPFRFTRDSTGRLFAGDVGQNAFEEVDLVQAGQDYGWPCFEGPDRTPDYSANPACTPRYAPGFPIRAPSLAYAHGDDTGPSGPVRGNAAIVGPVYEGATYPVAYAGRIFVADFVQDWVRTFAVAADGTLSDPQDFTRAVKNTVALRAAPGGDVLLIEIGNFTDTGKVTRIRFDDLPTAALTATPRSGVTPLEITFASQSSDPADQALTCTWSPGDGSPAVGPRPCDQPFTHVYSGPAAARTASLTVDDGTSTDTATLVVFPGDRPPVAQITAPESLRIGRPVALTGVVTDPDEPTDPPVGRWTVVLNHGGTHRHAISSGTTGPSVGFTPLDETGHGAGSWYEATLSATDDLGLDASTTVRIDPQTAQVTVRADLPDAPLSFGDRAITGTATFPEAIGLTVPVSAAASVTHAGHTAHGFDAWSDGGARSHAVTVPDGGLDLRARYDDPPVPAITAPATYRGGVTFTASFRATDPEQGTLPASALAWSVVDARGVTLKSGSGTSAQIFARRDPLTLRLTATDADGAAVTTTRSVAWVNTAPKATITAPSGFRTGQPFALGFTGTDPDETALPASALAWEVRAGDGTVVASGTGTGTTLTRGRGDLTVRLTVTDPDGLATTVTRTVPWLNTAPTAKPGGASHWRTGVPFTLSFAGTDADDGALPASALSWEVRDPTDAVVASGTGATATLTRSIPRGTLKAVLTVRDSDGAIGSATRVVTWVDTFPVPVVTGPATFRAGVPFDLAFAATDADDGSVPASRLTWTVKDTANVLVASGTGSGVRLSGPVRGVLTARLTATDSDGAAKTVAFTISWVNSAPAARVAAPDSYVRGAPFAVSFSGTDPDDGPLPGGRLAWSVRSSSGALLASGSGTSATAPAPGGALTISVTATDVNGAKGSASVGVAETTTATRARARSVGPVGRRALVLRPVG